MFNNQDFMGLGWRNDVGSVPVKDQDRSERPKSDEDRLINGLKWSYDYYDHDHADTNLQTVPEIYREEEEEEISKKDLLVVVPDEHSETGINQHNYNDDSDVSNNRCYLRNKQNKPKRRRITILSDEESEEFTREVPSVTRKGYKRIRRDEMSDQMRTLQQLVPNCHKTDKVSVLDKTIEYMKNLQLQLQVMSAMGMNSYFPPAMLDFGIMQNHMLTAMAVNRTASSPLFPALNWPLTQFTNFSFPNSTASSSPHQSLYGLVPCFPNFHDFSSHTLGRQ